MKINSNINFHKIMRDKTRIKIISLLKEGPLHGQAIAGKLGLKPPTISHHLTKLKEIDIVYQRRDKNTIYFYLKKEALERMALEIIRIGCGGMIRKLSIVCEEKAMI